MDQSASARSEVLPPLQPCVSSSPVRKSSNGIEGNNNGFSAAKGEDESVGEKTGDLIGPQKSHESTSGNQNSGGDVLLQWGQRKRSKRAAGDKLSMHPPRPPPPSGGSRGGYGGTKLGPNSNGVLCSKDGSSRKMGASGGGSGGGATANGTPVSKSNGGSRLIPRSGLGKRSHPASEKTEPQHQHQHPHPPPPPFGSIRKDKSSDSMSQSEHNHHHQLTSPDGKGSGEGVEWPRIYVALSRKEKEDDFFAMKGTKLPHRPKKRSKAIDRTLQYCFPGTFLSDLSRARYEVRERKSTVKKPKRRGLKGLENMETDSD